MSDAEKGGSEPRRSSSAQLQRMSDALRLLALRQHSARAPAELATALVAADALTVLMTDFLVHDVQSPDWPDRDRLVFSGATLRPLVGPLLHLLGQPRRADDTSLARAAQSSPENQEAPPRTGEPDQAPPEGMDLPFSRPGHGLAAALGLALATRLLMEEFGADLLDHATWVLADDADMEPGLTQEAIALAPSLRPHRLVVAHFTAAGATPEGVPGHLARFAAAGWHVQRVDAGDIEAVRAAFGKALEQDTELAEERRPAYVALECDARAPLPDEQVLRDRLGMEEERGEPGAETCDAWRLLGLGGSVSPQDL